MPLEENGSPVRVGVWIKVRISFMVGEEGGSNQTIRVWVSFGVGGQFSAGAIVLEPGKITEKETPFILKFIEQYYFKIFEEFFLYRHFYNKQIFI